MTELDELWTLVDKSEPNHPKLGSPCWVWLGNQNGWGYGTLNWQGKNWIAHRLVYTLLVGPIPHNRLACHKCDRPRCVNPEHLFIGTNASNLKDAREKGRWKELHKWTKEEKEARRKYIESCRVRGDKFN